MAKQIHNFLMRTSHYGGILIGILTLLCVIIASCDTIRISKKIQSFEVVPSTATIGQGDTRQFHATIIYTDGSRQQVTDQARWISSDPTVVFFDPDHGATAGVATGLQIGTATVTALYENLISQPSTSTVVAEEDRKLFVYIGNNNGSHPTDTTKNGVSYCPVQLDGTLGTCKLTSTGFLSTSGIAINSAGTYAYVSHTIELPGSVFENAISACKINQTNGDLTDCNTFRVPQKVSGGTANIISLAYDDVMNLLYAIPFNNPARTLYTCSLSSDGSALETCARTDVNGGNEFTNIAINPANTFLYFSSGQVGYCQIPTRCTRTYTTNRIAFANTPTAVVIHQSNKYAYVSDTNDNKILRCDVNSDGSLGSGATHQCTQAVQLGSFNSFGIVLNPRNSNIYVIDTSANAVFYCTVGTDSPACTEYTSLPGAVGTQSYGLAITP